MIDPALSASAEELAREIQEVRELAGDRPVRFSAALRSRIVAYAEACQDRGESANRIAPRLGLHQTTLSRWQRRSRGEAPFRRVAIVPTVPAPSAQPGPLRLFTPQGFVVEGLSVDALAYVLKAVG